MQPGERVGEIAQRYHVGTDQLSLYNPGVDLTRMRPGQKLRLPPHDTAGASCPPGLAPYAIQPGDTLWELAHRGRTTVEVIMRHNPGLDPCNLRIGQVICVPAEVVQRPGYGARR